MAKRYRVTIEQGEAKRLRTALETLAEQDNWRCGEIGTKHEEFYQFVPPGSHTVKDPWDFAWEALNGEG